ncbi:MAG TPA: glycosyl hydrolase [Sphingobium sp.]|uniref:glycosyl hydrolase n=1 Tax=Sphingobium sp. TaxID=1912891 RepID=UPI002ED09F4A
MKFATVSAAALLLCGTIMSSSAMGQEAVHSGTAVSGAATQPADAADRLRAEFTVPPADARPRVWWHWMSGNITKEGIRKDLEWMKRIGIGGMQTFDADLGTQQIVAKRLVYMTPEWKDAFRYAAGLGEQMGLEFAIASSPGWSETGGPWVEPRDGMKKLVWRETIFSGGNRSAVRLAPPPGISGPFQDIAKVDPMAAFGGKAAPPPQYYADVAVLAYPATTMDLTPVTATDAEGAVIDASVLTDGNLDKALEVRGTAGGAPPTIYLTYARPQTVRAATIFVPGGKPAFSDANVKPRLEVSDDGKIWRTLAEIEVSAIPTTVSFAPQIARLFRVVLEPVKPPTTISLGEPAPGADIDLHAPAAAPTGPKVFHIAELRLWGSERIDQYERKAGFDLTRDYYTLSPTLPEVEGVDPKKVVDLTDKMRPDGTLDWTPPPGTWRVVRFGYSLVGTTNHPAPAEATGLEVDKFDGGAVRAYLERYLQTYREAAGPDLIGDHGVRALLTDSIEVGTANWTPRLIAQFRQLRGYDPLPYLPALTGEIVGSRGESDRFLYDYRRTLSDLIASEHYGTVAAVAHANKLKVYGEALEDQRPIIGDDMAMRSHADVPMAAMWTYGAKTGPRATLLADIKGAASVAHIYGQNLVAAESLTSLFSPWADSPASLRPVIDLEFVKGVNRVVIHTSVHQPVDDKLPGISLFVFGQYFNRNDTWAEMAGPWIDYIARSSYLLQQGRNVADVAYFYGEEAPLTALYGEKPVADAPVRFAYDFANVGVLMDKLSVQDGDLVSPAGARYRALYLGGSSGRMTLPTLARIASLVEAGATVIGPAPTDSPSLNTDRAAYQTLVARLWTGQPITKVGKGQVIAGTDIEGALKRMNVAPDFEYSAREADANILFIHRKLDDGDVYFVSNRNPRRETVTARFRAVGKAPEIWRADSNTVEAIPYRTENGVTVASLDLDSQESYFIVFRKPGGVSSNLPVTPRFTTAATLTGPWTLSFASPVGSPAPRTLTKLAPLNENADPLVKYFSGVTTYTTSFDTPRGTKPGTRMMLDLGKVGELAEVRVNGRDVGTVWHAPFRIDIGAAVKPGSNHLEVRIANLWVNRLIGDAQKDAKKVTFTTMPTYKPDAPLRTSGLIGPVTLSKPE